MIKAAIDIGSNSVLLLIAEVIDGKIITEICDLSNISSLGKDLDSNGLFLQESIDRTIDIMSSYRNEIDKYNIKSENIFVTATEASRVAKNSKVLFNELNNKLGFNVHLISERDEALYTAYGVCSGSNINFSQITIADIGGASTELIKVDVSPFSILNIISLPCGSVRVNDWNINGTFDIKFSNILSENNINPYINNTIFAVGGTMLSIARMITGKYLQNYRIDITEFNNFVDSISNIDSNELSKKYEFLEERSSIISFAGYFVGLLFKKLKIENIIVSSRGLRYGTLLGYGKLL